MAPLGQGKRDGARRIQVIGEADDVGDGGRVRSGAKRNEALRDNISLYRKKVQKTKLAGPGWGQPVGCKGCGLLVLVEGTAGGHVVDLVTDILQDGLVFILSFFADPVDDISILGDSSQDHVDQLDDVDHVLLDETA